MIIKNSKEEVNFIAEIVELIKRLNTNHINSKKDLECIIQYFANSMDSSWYKHLKMANITKHSKVWWNENCQRNLKIYRESRHLENWCHIQVHLSGNNVPAVKPPPNHTSPPSTVATFLATCLMAVLWPSGYSIFHSRDTPIQLSLSWWSYSCQCLNTETSAWGNRGFATETLSISYNISLYIRLVVTL